MGFMAGLSDVDLQSIADEVVGRTLIGIEIDGVVAKAGRDHDGDPAVLVRIAMPSGSPIIPPRMLAEARVALWKTLEGRGDERLAYLSVDWPGDEVPPSPDVPT